MSVGGIVHVCLMMNEDLSSVIMYLGTGMNEQVGVSTNLCVSELAE